MVQKSNTYKWVDSENSLLLCHPGSVASYSYVSFLLGNLLMGKLAL